MEFTRSYLQALEAEDEHLSLRTIVDLADATRTHLATAARSVPIVPIDHSWREQAACLDTDPDLFFPAHPNDRCDDARAVCATCPVQEECLGWALERDERFGVWGGKNQQQLSAMRKVPRRSRCRNCNRVYVREAPQILYCDECRVERGDKRWMPDQAS